MSEMVGAPTQQAVPSLFSQGSRNIGHHSLCLLPKYLIPSLPADQVQTLDRGFGIGSQDFSTQRAEYTCQGLDHEISHCLNSLKGGM